MKSNNCWFTHVWSKWYPLNAKEHTKQLKTCKRCGKRVYREVGLS